MKKKTPLTLLIEKLDKVIEAKKLDKSFCADIIAAQHLATELLPLEKQAIEDAYDAGYFKGYDSFDNLDSYFKNTYE